MTKRILVFLYGSVSYLIFLATFLYAIAFIGGFFVPTRLDGPTTQSAWLGAGRQRWPARAVRGPAQRDGPQVVQGRAGPGSCRRAAERSTYVLFSSLALILLFWQWRPMGGVVWSVEDPVGCASCSTACSRSGGRWCWCRTFLINHFDLFGLRQVWLFLTGKPYTALRFVTPAPYRLVRHPLYLGWLFAFWATPTMTVAHLLFAVATTAYILLAIQFEERDLVREHGEATRSTGGRCR